MLSYYMFAKRIIFMDFLASFHKEFFYIIVIYATEICSEL